VVSADVSVSPALSPRGDDRDIVSEAWSALATVPDPEVPVVSIVELGIVRGVSHDGANVVVTLTPTYSGCPATEAIEAMVRAALRERRIDARVQYALAPAWTTDWIAPEARARLRAFGIAPPGTSARVDVSGISPLRRARIDVACPRCGSRDTALVSQFGSTACKAQYRCKACAEPFDYFKPH
jgi:ring-1,2-phenylacetyl-CoA epoxidase subunit PaaD